MRDGYKPLHCLDGPLRCIPVCPGPSDAMELRTLNTEVSLACTAAGDNCTLGVPSHPRMPRWPPPSHSEASACWSWVVVCLRQDTNQSSDPGLASSVSPGFNSRASVNVCGTKKLPGSRQLWISPKSSTGDVPGQGWSYGMSGEWKSSLFGI